MRSLGVIAGSGDFPLRVCESAKRAGFRVVAVAHRGETERRIETLADEVHWVKVGQLGRIVEILQRAGVDEAAMAGGIRKVRIFGGLASDRLARQLAARLLHRNDDGLLRGVASVFEERGISIVPSTLHCPDLLAKEGLFSRAAPSEEVEAEIRLGLEVARLLGRADVGQTVCVKDGAVVAVEGVEGTDACLLRAGKLAGSGITIVKTAKPQQDMRFDVPCVGPNTIKVCRKIGARALAIEAGRTLVLDEEATIRAADRLGLVFLAVR